MVGMSMRVTKAVGVSDMQYYVVCLTGEERDAVLDLVRSTLNKGDYASLNRKLTVVERKLELPSRSYNQAERFLETGEEI